MIKLKIPYAVGNFEKIREDGYYYVDKTEYIRQLEQYEVPVFLRPRRFGKTLWCSTLECYYDINRKDKFESLFGNLAIGKNPTGNQNRFMVLRFNLSKIQVEMELAVLEKNFRNECLGALDEFLSSYSHYFKSFELNKETNIAGALSEILYWVNKNDCPKVYLIVDEYDNFSNQLITANREDLYKEVTSGDSFLRTFFKVVKAGVESQAIGKVFITGVLPITMDDLTSGFNIAEIITLEPTVHSMLGFTESEVTEYLTTVFNSLELDLNVLPELQLILKEQYNGYRFLSDSPETLYNSTIITFFFKSFVLSGGKIPRDMIDSNIKTDVSWIKKLCGGQKSSTDLIEPLINGEGLSFDETMLSDKFNMNRFFEPEFYPISLFYLGMLTVISPFRMNFPNQTLTKIFTGYYNELSHFAVSIGYTDYFEQFLADGDMNALFAGYFKTYIGQIPAQAFDRINENFIRTTFFELCSRYLARWFTFAIEVNYPSGRSDWEMLGRPDSEYKNQKTIIEFKYFKKSDKSAFDALSEAKATDIVQVKNYVSDTVKQFPQYSIKMAVLYVCANEDFKFFSVTGEE